MFNQLMFRTLEESNAYMAEERRKAREADGEDLAKAKTYFKGSATVFANDHAMKSAYFKELADSYNSQSMAASLGREDSITEPIVWRTWLDVQDLDKLIEIAAKISTNVSGNKKGVHDGIVTKLAVYEDCFRALPKNELKELCQFRGVKGYSTLAKEPLVDILVQSYFKISRIVLADAPLIPDPLILNPNALFSDVQQAYFAQLGQEMTCCFKSDAKPLIVDETSEMVDIDQHWICSEFSSVQ